MDVNAEIVTFFASDKRSCFVYYFYETKLGVAASVIGEDCFSIRLKSGFYARELTETDVLRLLVHGP
jgi:hypothetical protein